jgi:hypothetical protein
LPQFREPERLHETRSSGQRNQPGCPVAVVHRRHTRLAVPIDTPRVLIRPGIGKILAVR